MTKQTLRDLIINLLDDEDGVNEKAHVQIFDICAEHGWNDINQATEMMEGRSFLYEAKAEELRKVVVVE